MRFARNSANAATTTTTIMGCKLQALILVNESRLLLLHNLRFEWVCVVLGDNSPQ